MQSVTIICKNAEVADALATTVFVLGEHDGLALINHLQGVECIIVNNDQEFVYSEHVKLNLISVNEQ
jgi:thiamine biosynthesis lipoprotein